MLPACPDTPIPLLQVSMTLIKYTPQALLNAQRCSTEGWSINNVLLDLAGGLLSFSQVGLNAFARGDLSVITGNCCGCTARGREGGET
jgi:cystinosin